MEAGVVVEVDPQAFEVTLGTMFDQTSRVQLGELLLDPPLSSLGFEEEGPLEGVSDNSIGSNPEETHPLPDPPGPSSERRTWALDKSSETQTDPFLVCRISDISTKISLCSGSTRFCSRAAGRLSLLLHSESLEYAVLSRTLSLPVQLPTVPRPDSSEQGSAFPILLLYTTAVLLSVCKWTCLGTGR